MRPVDDKNKFIASFKGFVQELTKSVTYPDDGQWTIKGFVDIYKNVFTISNDTKIISKILEIHLFPTILKFAESIGYNVVLAEFQNYYPDLTFVKKDDESVKFAVDLKTTYRRDNGKVSFTLGSHGGYFKERTKAKNIQFPYNEYKGHFCLGAIYSRTEEDNVGDNLNSAGVESYKVLELGKSEQTHLDGNSREVLKLRDIPSVIKDLQFFFVEKWKIASDAQGSGNTANIGSVSDVDDIIKENGVFAKLGEKYFDSYWLAYGTTYIIDGNTKKINSIYDFLESRGELNKKRHLVGNGAKKEKVKVEGPEGKNTRNIKQYTK